MCRTALAAGSRAIYERATRTVTCINCPGEEADTESVDTGVAGASARREFERRRNNRENRIRERFPRIGGLVLALSDDPQSTTAWATGAGGEEQLGRRLDATARVDVRVLHDRRIPGSRANIDHIVVSSTGVYVIDAKKYKGRPTLRIEGGFLRARTEQLRIESRDGTRLVAGVQGQVSRVLETLEAADLEFVPVTGMLCFVEADWPLFGGDFVIDGVHVLWPRKAVTHVTAVGGASVEDIELVHRLLANAFPPA